MTRPFHTPRARDYNAQRMSICRNIRRPTDAASLVGILLVSSLLLASTQNLPFGPWKRASQTPILSPQGDSWESAGTFNPAVVIRDGKIVMLYRAQDAHGTSR